jgi:hypothetical protein
MEQELNQLELKTESETSLAIVEMLKTLSWHLADKPLPRNLLPKNILEQGDSSGLC